MGWVQVIVPNNKHTLKSYWNPTKFALQYGSLDAKIIVAKVPAGMLASRSILGLISSVMILYCTLMLFVRHNARTWPSGQRLSAKTGLSRVAYHTIGVSDATTMGHEDENVLSCILSQRWVTISYVKTLTLITRIAGMRYSLHSRESSPNHRRQHQVGDHGPMPRCQHHNSRLRQEHAWVCHGNDRHNRPSLMIGGGTSMPGYSRLLCKAINSVTPLEALGAYNYGTLAARDSTCGATALDVMDDVERHSCPGAGACGCMFTANTMATAIEAMGLTLPGSSSAPATSPTKMRECEKVASAIKTCLEENVCLLDLVTRRSMENAITMVMVMGGSTNAVLHFWQLQDCSPPAKPRRLTAD